jgi:hypothetical protein
MRRAPMADVDLIKSVLLVSFKNDPHDLIIRGVTRKVHFAVEGPTPPTKDLILGAIHKLRSLRAQR